MTSKSGKMLANFTTVIQQFCQQHEDTDALGEFVRPLAKLNQEWGDLTTRIAMQATQNPDAIGAAAVDYMYFSGYVTLAYLWARMAAVAYEALQTDTSEHNFYDAKIKTAQFYFSKILPRTKTHIARIDAGHQPFMDMTVEQLVY